MALPIIDVRQLNAGPAEKRAVARELHQACTDTGFFYIAHHGISPELQAATLAEVKRFFALPVEEKLLVDKSLSPCNRGYEKMRDQVLEAGTPPDLKEGFYVGEDLPPTDPRVIAGLFNHGPNQWPPTLPSFRPVLESYFSAMAGLATTLMRGMALSLDLEEDYFDAFCADQMAILRLLHYPPQPANPMPDEKGCGAHTDWGCLTLLWQDDAGGLQVHTEGEWMPAPPIPGTYVVNVGDLFARWTNDLYRSTLHRVINASGRERYSIPYFFEGNPTHEVACIPTCLAPGASPLYAPTTLNEHLQEMYRRTYVAA